MKSLDDRFNSLILMIESKLIEIEKAQEQIRKDKLQIINDREKLIIKQNALNDQARSLIAERQKVD